MGYYSEVGVGGKKDIVAARKWYAKVCAPSRSSGVPQS